MRLDECSEFRGHKLKNCSRCGQQFDALHLTKLNCDQLNAIKDKEWQFGFRWKLSDWAVGEVIKVDVCPSCYADVLSLIVAKRGALFMCSLKQLNIPMRLCPFCNEHKPKGDFYKVPDHVVHSFVMRSTIYTRDKKQTQQFLNSIYSPDGPMVCSDCVAFMNEKFEEYFDTENHKIPVYIGGEYHGEVYAEPYEDDMLQGCCLNKDYMLNFKNGIHIKLEERKMKNVNETKNQNHAFAIERNYDETDRKLFRLEDAETGDFVRLATDEDRLIYMVVNTEPVKSRIKVNEKSGSNCVWCVCIQTQDLVELNGSEMVYVYDPRYIAFRMGRFIDA